ncbi:MAG: T9SS type A sorting domain-containing protein [Bacteroidota bacterium]
MTVNNNTITIKDAGTTTQVSGIEAVSGGAPNNNTITIANNLIANCTRTAATSGTYYGIWNSNPAANLLITGNTITNNSTNATSGSYWNIYNNAAITGSLTIANNVISGISFSATSTSNTNYNIYNTSAGATATINISGNSISNFNWGATGLTGIWGGIYTSAIGAIETIQNNIISNINIKSSTTIYLYYCSNTTPVKTFSGNSGTNITRNYSAGAGTTYFVYNLGASTASQLHNVYNNTFDTYNNTNNTAAVYGFYWYYGAITTNFYSNMLTNVTCTAATGAFYGIYGPYYAVTPTYYNNTISNIYWGTAGTIYGWYYYGYYNTNGNVYNNTWSNINGGATIYGIYYYIPGGLNAGTHNLFRNKITDLNTSSTTGIVYGIYSYGLYANQTHNIYNNLIGNLTASLSTNANAVSGIYISQSSQDNLNISYNTINLSGTSSGLGFGSSGIYGSTTYSYNLRNNIIVNNQVPTGAGVCAAHKRSSTTIGTYLANSNNNLLYAGTPSPSTPIYYDGTTSYSTIAAYKTYLSSTGQESLSVTENPTFVTTVGTSSNFLNINTTSPTLIESAAANISGITTDYAGNPRNFLTPDIGAWEGNYTQYPCAGAPTSNTIGLTTTVMCPNGNVTYGLSQSYSVSYNYLWQASATGSTSGFTSIPSGTMSSGTYSSVPADRWIQCVITCTSSSSSITLNPVFVSAGGPTVSPNTLASSTLVCWPGASIMSLSNAYGPLNPAYQWFSSTASSSGPFTAVSNATNNTYAASTLTQSVWYKCNVTCPLAPSASVASIPLQVSVNSNSTASTYSESFEGITAANTLPNCSWNWSNGPAICQTFIGAAGTYNRFARTGNNYASFRYGTNVAGDYYYTSPYYLTAGQAYSVSAWYITDGLAGWSEFSLLYGQSQSSSGLTNIASATGALTNTTYSLVGSSFTPTASGYFYFAVKCVGTSAPWYLTYDDLLIQPLVPCTGAPSAGNAVAALTAVCPSVATTLSLSSQSTYTNIGLSYQWLASTTNSTSGYAPISNATVNTLNTGTISSTTWYQCAITCSNSGLTTTLNTAQVTVGVPNNLLTVLSSTNSCILQNVGLSLSSSPSGYSYQWQASTTGSTTGYANLTGSTLATATSTGITANTWFQNVLTCTANTSFSAVSLPAQMFSVTPVTYAPVPFIENFDNTWSNRCDLRNVLVFNYWDGTPTTGNTSWRRQDDYIAGAWSGNSGAITPLTGAGCARFHSYDATSGTSGSMLLYLNMTNASPNYSLSFYYINTSGTDVLNVNFSTNGGSTYSTLATYSVSGAWAKQIINLGAVNSSSCILSFSATSDYGVTDIGIDSLEVKTCPNPIVTASSSSVCPGAPAILSASGANAFTWFNAATGSTVGVTPTASTVYSVSGSNGLCAVSRTVQVNTYSVPIISIANSGSACVGTNASLTASGATTYSWSNGLSGATITPSITSNTSYSVLGTSAVGCTASANSSVAVRTNSTISASSAPSVCPGQSLNLTASGAVTYTWNTGSTNTVTVYTPSINTTYTVNGTDANGCVNFATATVTMAAVPALTVTATSPSLCAGNAVTITASGANTYSWNTGATSAIISPTLNTSTSFTLLGTSVVGCTATSTGSIQVSPNPTLTFAGSTGICTGQTVNLTVSGANTYSWSTGSLTNSISTTPITNTTYTVTGTDLLGCKTTSTQLVTVAASLSITIAGPSTICVGQAANLTGNGGVTYTWNTGSTTQTIAPTPTITTTYSIVGASGTCSNSGVATVSVNPNPTVTVAGSLTICAGQTTTLTGNGASTYSWSSGASSSTAALSPSTNTTYTLMGTNSVGCSSSVTANVIANPLPIIGVSQTANTICVNSPVSFTASGANTYTWNNTVNASTVALTPTANITAIYTVAATSSVGCVNSRTVALATYSLPVLSITPASATVCSLSQATFNAAGATTYTWNNTVFTQTASFVPTSSTVYTLSGTNTSSCVSTVTVGVTTNTLPILSITPATATVCALSPATFSAGGATTYTWTGNVVSSTVAFTPSASTVYSLTGTNPAGCVTTNTVAVTTNTLPLITVAPSSASVCAFSTSTYAPSGANSYTWANTSSNTLSSVSNSAIITPSASAIYTVSGTNPAGCIGSKTLAIGVYNLPTLIINPASPTVCSLSQLTFTATGASTYTWNGTVNTATAVFNPTVNSTYTLVGADVNNCVSTTTVAVVTNTLPIVSINSPTSTTCVFSPVTYTASGANTYTWNTNATGSTVTMYPSSNTVYTVTGTSPAGCNTSNTVAISTNSLPIVGITPSLITVCALSNVSLTAAGAVTYTWSNASTNTNVVVTPSASSVFSLAGTNSLGCVGIANAVVITNTLPVIGISASSASNCATSAVSFTANGGTTYTWSTGSNGSTVSVTPSITTTYSVFGVDPNNGCVGSKTISVNTFSLPIVNIATSAASVCPGASASFTASGAQSYSWAIGFAVPSVTVTPSTASVYVVVGTDALGCSSTGSVSLGLFNLPNVAVSPANQTICVNEVASFTASGASSYTWIPVNSNTSTFTVSPTSISFYTVVGLDANACTNYTTFLVNVSKCTGLAQNAISSGQISVFPNPSMGKVTAEFDFDGVKEIHIVNAIGEFILGIKTENKQETFNLSGYAKGIYYVRIKANGQSSNFRVIIE